MNRAERRAQARGKTVQAPRQTPRRKPEYGSSALEVKAYYWPNHNYDHEGILQRYSGWEHPIDAVIQHGVDFETERVYPGEAYAPCTTAWSWSELRDKAWAQYKPAIRGSAPFVYLAEMEKWEPDPNREGTLYAPMHGTTGVQVGKQSSYYYHLARSLKDLPQPVTVSLYYQEMNDPEIVRAFEKNGCNVICTVPDVNSPSALKNQLDAFSKVSYYATNDIGTGTLYATFLGIPAFLYGDAPTWTYSVAPGMDELFEPTKEARRVWAEAAEPFREFSDTVTPERLQMATFHLGLDRKMDPATMKEAFMWAASRRWPR